jgi:methylmalonyl-CoA mutase
MSREQDSEKLFSEFSQVSTEQWEEKISTDLKGADYNKRLIWNTGEGFLVKPYYRSGDLHGLDYIHSLSQRINDIQKDNLIRKHWIIRQDIPEADIVQANRIAREAVSMGAEALGLNAKDVTTHAQMARLLEGLDLHSTEIHFISSQSYPLTIELFLYEIRHRKDSTDQIAGSLNFDPIGYMLRNGDPYLSFSSNLEEAEYLITTVEKRLPGLKAITVNGRLFQEAGSSLIQELAFSLSAANEYLAGLTEKGLTVDKIAPRILFSLDIGSAYFLEIAKLRAIRLLWPRIVQAYKPESREVETIFIHASTASWNKSIYDPYNNILRTTTESMAAILGNADYITIQPFDHSFRQPDEFSIRTARNQQLILREEAYLDKVYDPAAGSYYIETLTDSMIRRAWHLFRDIEERGGIMACISSGYIQEEIKKSRNQKEQDIARRNMILIGTNQYPDIQECMLDEMNKPEPEKNKQPSSYERLPQFRVADSFEKIRLATERHVQSDKKRPSVFLFNMGNLAWVRARAGFTTNFFGCAGYEIIDNSCFFDIDEGVQASCSSGAEMIVICSGDDEYTAIVPEITRKIKQINPSILVLVAGYPKNILEHLKSAGVDDFIYVRCDVLEKLTKFQKVLIQSEF